MSDFEIIPDLERPELITRGRPPTPLSLVLATGRTVFMPTRPRLDGQRGYLSKRGLRLHTQAGERNGVQGFYAWTEPLEPKP